MPHSRFFRITFAAVTLLTGLALLAGCDQRPLPNAPAPSSYAAAGVKPSASRPSDPAAGPDGWLGEWTGPEGTFLRVEGGEAGRYQLTIRNLDGPRTFDATADGDTLRFERDGQRETVRATDGVATGMKWLAGKPHCLTVHAGEGYCRD